MCWSVWKKQIYHRATFFTLTSGSNNPPYQKTRTYLSYIVNSSPPNAAYMRQWIRLTLVQIMACCLFGTKPLSKPMLGHCQFQWNLIKILNFLFTKMHLKILSAKWWPFCLGRWVNAMVVCGMAMQGARASTAIIFTYFMWNIPAIPLVRFSFILTYCKLFQIFYLWKIYCQFRMLIIDILSNKPWTDQIDIFHFQPWVTTLRIGGPCAVSSNCKVSHREDCIPS